MSRGMTVITYKVSLTSFSYSSTLARLRIPFALVTAAWLSMHQFPQGLRSTVGLYKRNPPRARTG